MKKSKLTKNGNVTFLRYITVLTICDSGSHHQTIILEKNFGTSFFIPWVCCRAIKSKEIFPE